jgi:hypothetical protein
MKTEEKLSQNYVKSTELSRQSRTYSRTSQRFIEPTGSLPCSQEPPPLVPILSQIDLVHTIPSYLSKPHFGLDDAEKGKFLPPPGLELRLLGRPARSQSLYPLSYPGSDLGTYMPIILVGLVGL